ncbi:MAG: hypothetical protein Ct9H90mP6_08570 [Gammaproteobacteria bacterium]|nr:MAG: hypothetical protein Ct9H90mP6_08570 [Gammaproteobacteria bacterium]
MRQFHKKNLKKVTVAEPAAEVVDTAGGVHFFPSKKLKNIDVAHSQEERHLVAPSSINPNVIC